MPLYKFWYVKEVKAKDLNHAMKIEKKHRPRFESLQEVESQEEREHQPLIGFEIPTESDYWKD